MKIKNRVKPVVTIEDFTDIRSIAFLKKSTWRRTLFHICGVLSLCIVYLVFYWYSLYYMLYEDASDFIDADVVCVTTLDNVIVLVDIKEDEFVTNPFRPQEKTPTRYIPFIERKYIYDHVNRHFYPIETIFGNKFEMSKPIQIEEVFKQGINKKYVKDITSTYGSNQLNFPEPSIFEMIITQLLHPIIVGLVLVALLCFVCFKYMQTITLLFYVVFIIVFQVVEYKGRTRKIKEMSEINQTIKVFRNDLSTTRKNLSIFMYLLFI